MTPKQRADIVAHATSVFPAGTTIFVSDDAEGLHIYAHLSDQFVYAMVAARKMSFRALRRLLRIELDAMAYKLRKIAIGDGSPDLGDVVDVDGRRAVVVLIDRMKCRYQAQVVKTKEHVWRTWKPRAIA